MEIAGRVIAILAETTGQGKNGMWRKQEFVIETDGQYPRKICFSLWGDKISQANIREGEMLTVSVDPESREYNGRWYTELRGWKVTRGGGGGNTPPPTGGSSGYTPPAPTPTVESAADDLPF